MLIVSELCGLDLSLYHHVRLIVTLFYRAANSNVNMHIRRCPSGKYGGTHFFCSYLIRLKYYEINNV